MRRSGLVLLLLFVRRQTQFVLDLLDSFLALAFGLFELAFSLELPVAGYNAGDFLDLAFYLLSISITTTGQMGVGFRLSRDSFAMLVGWP